MARQPSVRPAAPDSAESPGLHRCPRCLRRGAQCYPPAPQTPGTVAPDNGARPSNFTHRAGHTTRRAAGVGRDRRSGAYLRNGPSRGSRPGMGNGHLRPRCLRVPRRLARATRAGWAERSPPSAFSGNSRLARCLSCRPTSRRADTVNGPSNASPAKGRNGHFRAMKSVSVPDFPRGESELLIDRESFLVGGNRFCYKKPHR